MLKNLLFVFSFLLSSISFVQAQSLSNKGKEFWVGYGSHVAMYEPERINIPNTNQTQPNPNAGKPQTDGGDQNMVLYFTSDRNATVTVDIPGLNWTRTYNVIANQVTSSDTIPKSGPQDARLVGEGLSNKGIHIVSSTAIIAYAHIYNQSVSGATLLFPVSTLSREYYSLNYDQVSNNNYSYSYAYVIATEDNTTIEIIPSATTVLNKPAGVPYQISLNKGEVYTVFGRLTGSTNSAFGTRYLGEDLTGTIIRSVATATSPCKKIAVFSGSGKLSLTCNSNVGSSDNYMQQSFPPNAWGKKYLTVPTAVLPGNIYRIAVKDPNTVVRRNGVRIFPGSLIRGFFYEFSTDVPELIESDQPIMVAQYISSATMNRLNNALVPQSSCNNDPSAGTLGDPEMIYLSPIEQTINKVTINSTSNNAITKHYLNLVMHKDGLLPGKKFLLDGLPITQLPNPHPGDPNYVYFQIDNLASGSHTIEADSGFNAIAYGYGAFESYGYNAGTNVNDLNQYVSVQNEFATVPFPSTCKGAPFKFSITLPYQPIKIDWKFNNTNGYLKDASGKNATDPPSITNVGNPIVPDDIIPSPTDPTKLLYVYRLPAVYSFAFNGDFPVRLIVENTSAANLGCTGVQEIDYDVRVFDPPITKLNAVSTGCIDDRLVLNATNTLEQDVKPLKYIWSINGQTSETLLGVKDSLITTEGLKNVKLKLITNIGCVSAVIDTTIAVSPRPAIAFLADAVRCLDKSFTITDKSSAGSASTFAALKSWQWEFDGLKDASTLISTSPSKTFTQRTALVKLLVTSSTGCLDSVSQILDVFPNPVVDFALPESCVKDVSSFNGSLVSIADPTRRLTKFDWDFGDAGATNPLYPNVIPATSPNPVQHFYTAPGAYTVKLGVTSQDGCYELKDTIFEVNGSDPVADFSVVNASGLCSNTPIEIANKSVMGVNSFGRITRVRVFWNWNPALNPPVPDANADITDEVPVKDKLYNNAYLDFNNVASKNYTIRMVAYSGESCFTDKFIQVPIKGSPVVNFNPIPSICLDTEQRSVSSLASQIDVSGIAAGNGIFSGPGIASNGVFRPYLVGAGDYPIKYTFTAANGCFDTLTQFIKVWPSPVSSYSTSTLICEKNEITFTSTANPVVGNLVNYEWIYSDAPATSFALNTNKKIFSTYGNFDVSHIVVTSNGCRDTLTNTLNINPLPVVDFKLANSICLPDGLAEFTNLTSTPDGKSMSYLWNYGDPGGNNQGTTEKGTHNFIVLKDYQVKLISTIPSTGCKDSITKIIQPLVDIFPQPQAEINSVDFVCIGTPIDFKEITDAKSGAASFMEKWNWDFVFTSSNSKDPNYLFRSPGTYTVKMTAISDKGCRSNQATKTVTIHPFPEISAGPDINVLDNGQKQLQATAKGTDLVYAWSPPTYLSATDVLQPVVLNPVEDMVYTLKVTGIGGCERTDKVKIYALKLIDPPNTFTPNGDGVNEVWEIKNLDLYNGCVVEIYTPQGLMVYRTVNYSKPWDGKYNGKPLPAGTYYYVINTNSERKSVAGYVTILK
jgi:gliding motility-associated-like protein